MFAWLRKPVSFIQFLIYGLITFAFASSTAFALASFNELGQIGGYEANTSTQMTVQNAAYASGNCLDSFKAVVMARYTGYHGIINRFVIASKGGGTTALTVYIFGSNPTGSTCTDKSTFTVAAADISKLICAPFVVTPAVAIGGTISYAENTSMQCHFVATNTSVYVGVVSGGTWTPASTSDLIFNLEGIAD